MEKRQIRMIAFDMDGTVLYDKNEISPKLQGILKKALDQGIYVVPCTGRGRCEMPRTLTDIGITHTATANGALVRDERTDQALYTNLIPWEMAAEIYHQLKKIDAYVTVHIDGKVYFKGESEQEVRNIYKLVEYIPMPTITDAEAFVREKQENLEKKPVPKRLVEASGLLEELKALRMKLAREENVPAYIVFSNATLQDMAEKAPTTMDAFLEVSGVGKYKAERYGAEFLNAIREYASR